MIKRLLFQICLTLFAFPTYALEVGQTLPDCVAEGLHNSAYKGKVIMVDFWATWCPPCGQSMPFLNSLRNELHDKGFEIVAINVDEDTETAKQYLAERPVSYPVFMDAKGSCPEAYGVQAMPSSYFVDKTGKVRFIHLGYRDSDQAVIRKQIQQLLEE